jgi:hypothetical protein
MTVVENAGIIFGMIAAFLAGAWVRRPFRLRPRGEIREEKPPCEACAPKDAALMVQMENLLNYGIAGKKQREIDEDED